MLLLNNIALMPIPPPLPQSPSSAIDRQRPT